ncbi:MFS transporter [Caldibacillus thermoamylovorans]|uniref:MFS transporter n=1 Tax=Caldibacillus thermoamylovorans TaxID=35841 RepID=UPI0022E8A2E1|nr:MFS transporter [Caldibacillus thermoamylovorans]
MWKNKNILILLSGQLVSELGIWFGLIGNLEFLQRNVSSHFLQAIFLVVGGIVGVLIGPYAGKMIDIIKKKKLLIVASLGRIIAVSFMFVAIFTDSVWWMLAYSICIGSAASLYTPTLQSVIPLVVHEKELTKANILNFNITTVARIFGTMLGGILLVSMSLFSLYLMAFIAYSILFVLIFFLCFEENNVTKISIIKKNKNKSADFWAIIPEIRKSAVVKTLVIVTLIPTTLIASFNLIIIEISKIQQDPLIKGLIYAIEGITVILAGFFIRKNLVSRDIMKILIGCCFLIGFTQLSLYFADNKWIALVAFALFGLALGTFLPLSSTVFQKHVTKDFHGRFFSLKSMLERIIIQISILVIGLLLDVFGLKPMIVGMGIVSISIILVIFFAFRVSNLSIEEK